MLIESTHTQCNATRKQRHAVWFREKSVHYFYACVCLCEREYEISTELQEAFFGKTFLILLLLNPQHLLLPSLLRIKITWWLQALVIIIVKCQVLHLGGRHHMRSSRFYVNKNVTDSKLLSTTGFIWPSSHFLYNDNDGREPLHTMVAFVVFIWNAFK